MLPFDVQFSSEIKNRIKLSVAAYAYEYKDDPIMSDAEFDSLSLEINPGEKTGNKKMDNFFKKNFESDTGMWIRKHPEKHHLDYLYQTYYKEKKND
jgi:hypothetical protein